MVPLMADRRAAFIVLLLLSIVLITFPNITTVRATDDSWTTKEPMPTARNGLGVAVVNDKIYAIGGSRGILLAHDDNEEYNPITDTWTFRNPMPTPRGNFAIAVFQNKIYTFGGATRSGGTTELTTVTEVYDPATDAWETKTSMPTLKGYFSANVVNNKIYLVSGLTQSTPNASLYLSQENLVYDPITDSWATKKPIPTATHSYVSAVVDNRIYVIAGSSGNLTQIYNPATDTWSNGESIPTAIQNAAGGATTGIAAPKAIYVFGGFIGFVWPINLTQVYHPENDTWSIGTDMPTPLYELGVAVVKDHLYAIGGRTGYLQPVVDQNNQYTPIDYIPEFPSWTLLLVLLIAGLTVILVRKKMVSERCE